MPDNADYGRSQLQPSPDEARSHEAEHRAIRRGPAVNVLVLLGLVAFLVVAGAILWFRWSEAARTAYSGSGTDSGGAWAMVIIGGPVILLAAFIFAKLRTLKATRRADPATPATDPSKGMSGHD